MTNSHYPKIILELRPTPMIPGEIGVFAVRRIRMGAIMASAKLFRMDVWLTWGQWAKIDRRTRQKLYQYCPGQARGLSAPRDLNHLSLPWFTNHSCDPNSGFDRKGNLVAIRDIAAREEIVWDYSTLEANPKFRMKCKCGSTNCRKVITASKSKAAVFR